MRIVGFPLLIPALALALTIAGCLEGRGLGGQEGEDLHGDTSEVDSGSDADTDTDTDTDADTDSDTIDTAVAVVYAGTFLIDATDAAGVADRCSGTLAVTLDGGSVTGAAACTFAGPLAASFPDGLGAAVFGIVAEDGVASGTVRFTIGVEGDLPWTGALGTNLVGAFAGSASGTDTVLTVTGAFDASPE